MDSTVKTIIKVAMGATAAAGGFLGVTGGDTVVLAGAWGGMMLGIAGYHGVPLDKETCVKICASIIASFASYKMGCMALTWALTVLTAGLAALVAGGLNAIINGYLTYRLGRIFDKMYGEEGYGVVKTIVVSQIVKSLLHVPTPDEFRDFWATFKNG